LGGEFPDPQILKNKIDKARNLMKQSY